MRLRRGIHASITFTYVASIFTFCVVDNSIWRNTGTSVSCVCEAFSLPGLSNIKMSSLRHTNPNDESASALYHRFHVPTNSYASPSSSSSSKSQSRFGWNIQTGSNAIHSSRLRRTQLNGIRGFRSWFESQFPNAMTTIQHPHRKSKGRGSKPAAGQEQSSQQFQSETFHHVLIDMNQLLHITLRRARSEGHALTLLIQEMDKCMDIASPTKSIVLAFDGPPAAAKLATQRRRRYGTVVRAERKKARLEQLRSRGVIPSSSNTTKRRKGNINNVELADGDRNKDGIENQTVALADIAINASPKIGNYQKRMNKNHQRKKNKADKEEETLKITPGTEFMTRAHEAVLYWAWQRLDNPHGKLSNCKIYISPSTVPGEGEVKLLDWLIQAGNEERMVRVMNKNGTLEKDIPNRSKIVKPGESVAIMGGDSDLVLEGLVIPPTITHNVFVILPAGGKMSYVVSLWETTLTLGKYLGNNFDAADIMRVRTDLVLLLIMNGNDYLPKLRGSAGFNKLFHTYLRLLKTWLKEEKGGRSPYLVNPDGKMEFNLPFCITYFKMLASMAPKHLAQPSDMMPNHKSITPLSQLYSMVDAGFLPQPAEFERIAIPNNDEKEILRLVLGDESSNNNRIEFELEHRKSTRPIKKTKQILANMALEDLLGKDYMDLNDYYIGGKNDDNDADVDDDDFDWVDPISDGAYSWEINLPAASSVDEYLKGLLWNLATYQDGVCSDYGYTYGRRMSPTAEELVSYFEEAEKTNKNIDRVRLLGNDFVKPLNAGLSCLAALPSQVDHLVPQPYQQLSTNNKVEDIFGKCMDPDNNVFDMALFEKLCLDELRELKLLSKAFGSIEKNGNSSRSNLRKIRTGDTFWTVIHRVRSPLTHPFEPPVPFSDRLSYLKFNPRIKARHIMASSKPRWLRGERKGGDMKGRKGRKSGNNRSVKQSDMGKLLVNALGDDACLEDVGYKIVYQSREGAKVERKQKPGRVDKGKPPKKEDMTLSFGTEKLPPSPVVKEEIIVYEKSRMQEFGIELVSQPVLNTEQFNALQCLQQLHDSGLVRELKWEYQTPSGSKYASINPNAYEEVKVTVKVSDDDSFTLSQDRNTKVFGRKAVKHTIASIAMAKIFETHGDWSKFPIPRMKSLLSRTPAANTNSNYEDLNLNALQYINLLKDAKCLTISWDFASKDDDVNVEVVTLYIKGEGTRTDTNIDIKLKEYRNIYHNTKASSKHRLATLAMEEIHLEWNSMTIQELRDHIII